MTSDVRITFLGGLGEIGRNCAVIETDTEMLILDCGQMFGDETLPGVNSVLPDFAYILERSDKLVGCIATHSHEDHIGGLPYLLADLGAQLPIYGSPFTIGMIRNKLAEDGLVSQASFQEVADGESKSIGGFEVEFLPVTHSTPSGLISAISTPQGIVLHSSDFKLDHTPIDGRRTDLARIGAISNKPGIRLLLADSTNADSPGISESEMSVGKAIDELFDTHTEKRLIFSAFSSHIHRVQQIANAAVRTGRVIIPLGRSMKRNLQLARDVGILDIPDRHIDDIERIDDYPDEKVCVVATGSQGEPRAALSLMAKGESKFLEIDSRDVIVFSSHPIPGNEAAVARLRNNFARRGATVVHSAHMHIHTTGHGKEMELKTLHAVASPEWFVPVHGEYAHLVAHAALGRSMGLSDDRVVLCEDGDQITITGDGITRARVTDGAKVFIDGSVGHLTQDVIDDRLLLGQHGFLAIDAIIDWDRRELIGPPRLISRGWLDSGSATDILHEGAKVAEDAIVAALADPDIDFDDIERVTRRAIGRWVNARTRRRPVLAPMLRSISG
ncbi:MAG: ribonuclease J [Acidimicrobiales bacterium]